MTGCRHFVAVLALLLACATAVRAADQDFIRTAGTRLVDARGERFAIKGINLGNWLVPEGYMFQFARARSPGEIAGVVEALIGPDAAARFWDTFRDVYVAQEDIRFIKAAGFNTVRVPLHWNLFVTSGECGADKFEGPGWRLLDRVIAWSRDAGLRVIVDLHAAPGGQTGVNHDDGVGFPLTFYVSRHQRLTVALWRAIAARYRDDPTVLGYDLLNEPISPYSDEGYLNPRLEPFYRDIVAAIRSVDTNHVVFLAGGQWSSNFAMFGPPFDANVVYTYHQFWADPTRKSIQRYLNFSNRWKVPLLIGETGEATDTWNDQYRRLHERFGIGWSFWAYKNLDSPSTVVSIAKPAGWDLIADVAAADIGVGGRALPPRPQAQAILDAYLEAARFRNGRVNTGYLNSLGLAAP
jgi:hypothetical protein